MRKLLAIAAALGFLSTFSTAPVFAAPDGNGVTSTDISAQEKKATTKKPAKKKTKKPKAKKTDKKSSLIAMDISAQEKKAKAKKPAKKTKKAKKAKKPKAKKKSDVILYRIAA